MNRNKWIVRLCLGFVKLTGVLPVLLYLKPRVRLTPGAKRRLPKKCILVSNHIRLMDFALYTMVFPSRTIRFLIAEVMFNKSKFFGWFLGAIGGIKVDRDSKSFEFVAHSLDVLDQGGAIGVFPQGRLPVKGHKFPFTTSTAFIAMRTDAPIVPVYTNGNYGLFKRVGVVIGEPFYLQDFAKDGLSEKEQLAHLTNILEEKVYALKEELK